MFVDQTANDPEMMKEMSRMSKMNNKDRNALLHIQVNINICMY